MYLICKKTNGVETILHSDNMFYYSFICVNGCKYKVYKTLTRAQNKVNKLNTMYNNLQCYVKKVT